MTTITESTNKPEEFKTLPLVIEFGGGAELLFDKKKINKVNLPVTTEQWCMKQLLFWIRDNLLKERPELFLQEDTVRPGILVLINDADWELLDTVNYSLQANDRIIFISTLHGG